MPKGDATKLVISAFGKIGVVHEQLQFEEVHEDVEYPGGSFTNNLLKVSDDKMRTEYSIPLTLHNVWVTVFEIIRYHGLKVEEKKK